MTVGELLEAANRAPAHVVRAFLESERAGKARVSAISGLQQLLEQ